LDNLSGRQDEHQTMVKTRTLRARGRDPLDRACDRIWFEIRALLPRHRWLSELGPGRSPDQSRELARVSRRVEELKRLALRYRDVMREEAWARYGNENEDHEPDAS
jgi:hypothetical protein